MKHKQSKFDYDTLGAVIGVIIFIGIPFLILIWSSGRNTTTPSRDTTYEEWRSEQRQNEADRINQLHEQELEGYGCTSDCSGHQAGYQWAQANNVCEPNYSGGNSQSFNEGVRVWAANGC
jgi:hypothetical protein